MAYTFFKNLYSRTSRTRYEIKGSISYISASRNQAQKNHDGEVEECDGDLIRKPKTQRGKKETVRNVYREKEFFTWGPE